MSVQRVQTVNPIRAALQQAMLTPRVQTAVATFVNALVDEGETILRERYAGEALRVFMPKQADRGQREIRRQRICALAAPPSGMSPAQIAAREGVSERWVRKVLAAARNSSA